METINVTGLEITKNNDRSIIDVCKKWKLSKDDINNIFNLSKEYDYSPYNIFYQTPCDIVGKAKVGNEIWKFYINGGGMITLINKDKEIFLGCEEKKCEPFFIFPFDGMNP
ncbi:hypothetical protein M5U04_19115 [Xenorhabdus sp. XENO-1]|uniref:hypothetical protein n=1 Tax=Xenorhabdus bovienii TaxID=40576 RepID=UPI0020CA441B|nr:hypothetical protein [Xenorhabdus bovienii]MCP9270129.1 hypothetical protein [Xenorhabdus bovienii subsp. africana]